MGKRKASLPADWILQIQDFLLQYDSQAQKGAYFNTRSKSFKQACRWNTSKHYWIPDYA